MEDLPEGCITTAMSFATATPTPGDAFRLSAVSSMFKAAAESDTIWERFLPKNLASLIMDSSDPSLLDRFPSKKQLFLHLCDNPILIDAGLKSFSLDKLTGKKLYMLSPRDLTIIWGDTPQYWVWIPEARSRFNEVAELKYVCWLEIRGNIKTSMLSKNTCYTAYFVFQMTAETNGFEFRPVEVSVGLVGGEASKRTVNFLPRSRVPKLQVPVVDVERMETNNWKERGDGWLELEMGEFFNWENSEDDVLEMRVFELGRWKRGLIVHGIEIRPKKCM